MDEWESVFNTLLQALREAPTGRHGLDCEILHEKYDALLFAIARAARPDLVAQADAILAQQDLDTDDFWYS